MASDRINKYIEERYDRWLDHAKYFSSLAGIEDEAVDILNEVLCMLLQKNDDVLNKLFEAAHEKYTELDFYILKMIRLNITSPTSPYQHKYKQIPSDENVNWQRLEIEEEDYNETDENSDFLNKYRQVRDVYDSLNLSAKAQKIFSWKFFEDESFSDWPGHEDKRELYIVYNKILEMIRDRIEGRLLDF